MQNGSTSSGPDAVRICVKPWYTLWAGSGHLEMVNLKNCQTFDIFGNDTSFEFAMVHISVLWTSMQRTPFTKTKTGFLL